VILGSINIAETCVCRESLLTLTHIIHEPSNVLHLMERVGTLIEKLKDQLVQNAGRDKLLVTVQLLLAELQQQQIKPAIQGKISVIMPLYMPMKAEATEITQAAQPENPPEQVPVDPPKQVPANPPSPKHFPEQVPDNPPEQVPQHYPEELPGRPPEQVPEHHPEETPERPPEQVPEHNPKQVPEEFPERVPEQFPEHIPEAYPEQVPELFPEQVPGNFPEQGPGYYSQRRTEHLYGPQSGKPVQKEKDESIGWLFNPTVNAPTLEQQEKKEIYELNDIMVGGEESLNDKLKEEKLEVAAALHSAAVKDLKRAIGINDRYLYINELFRGDENMYERSLKTINGFSIYPEAQYWIQRELKVKLGWNERSEAVRLFDQLVIRRFS
jgi:outer membrane biosynthesis protein TonB